MTTEEKAELLQLETDLCEVAPNSLCQDYLSCCENCTVKRMARALFEKGWKRIKEAKA